MKTNNGLILTISIILMFALGCNENISSRDISNKGKACLNGKIIKIDFEQCLSSSCEKSVQTSCNAVVQGNKIEVSSRGFVEFDSSVDGCTLDCVRVQTECEVEGDTQGVELLEYNGVETSAFECEMM